MWLNIYLVSITKTDCRFRYFSQLCRLYWYHIIPVNPTLTEVLGKKSYPSIEDIPEKIDIVDVFRRSEDVPAVTDDAIRKKDGIKVIWMQIGIYNEEAEKKAKENGIDVVYNRCMMEEHKRLFAE